MGDWQTAETAPKDGSSFLAAFPCGDEWIIESIRWAEHWGDWSLSGVMLSLDRDEDEQFKFWHKLPDPPPLQTIEESQ